MDLVHLTAFTIAYAIVVLVPGPGVAAIVGRALGVGFASAVPMVFGILFGDLTYLVFAVFGLTAIATHFGAVFIVVRYAGAAYLLYVAWKFWSAREGAEQIGPRLSQSPLKTLLTGLALTLGNPKAIVFYLALLPTLMPLEELTLLGFAEAVTIVTLVLLTIGLGYAALAARARDVFKSPKALRRLNKATGMVLAAAAGAAIWR